MRLDEFMEGYSRARVDPELAYSMPNDPDQRWRGPKGCEPWRGPHQNKEISLLLTGGKPAALVNSSRWDVLRPHVESGELVYEKDNFGDLIVARADQAWRIPRIKKLLDLPYGKGSDPKYHIKLGLLFGYSKDQIVAFLKGIGSHPGPLRHGR